MDINENQKNSSRIKISIGNSNINTNFFESPRQEEIDQNELKK